MSQTAVLRAETNLGVPDWLSGFWVIAIAVMPLGHVTGLRNLLIAAVVVLTLMFSISQWRIFWNELPAGRLLVALLAWTAASTLWSEFPSVSWGKWRTDLLLPVLAYVGAFCMGRSGRQGWLWGGLVAGVMLLAVLSLFQWFPAQDFGLSVSTKFFPTLASPMPEWYPGVGDASTYVVLAAAPLLAAWRFWTVRWQRLVLLVTWAALVLTVFVSHNRNALLMLPLVVVVYFVASRARRSSLRQRVFGVALLFAALLLSAVAIEVASRHRLAENGVVMGSQGSAAMELGAADARPRIWRYYLNLAIQAPLAGVGFGRTVPGMHYHTADDKALATIDPNAYTHSHNLLLDWVLQTGLIGAMLLVAALVQILRAAKRCCAVTARMPHSKILYSALWITVLAFVVRNMTDDFMIFGIAAAIWTVMGGLGGMLAQSVVVEPD